jgi:diacylglycerol kinase family enzyme
VLSPAEAKKQSESIRHERASSITLTFDKPTAYAVDGEIYEGEKLEIKTCPRSLNVLTNFEEKD